jgi:hypothetical protein
MANLHTDLLVSALALLVVRFARDGGLLLLEPGLEELGGVELFLQIAQDLRG